MYLWVIIATFLAALAAMGTSLRADIKQLYVEPQAENVVTKIYTQHRGMMTGSSLAPHPGHGVGNWRCWKCLTLGMGE